VHRLLPAYRETPELQATSFTGNDRNRKKGANNIVISIIWIVGNDIMTKA
jgi:hypothetical protein